MSLKIVILCMYLAIQSNTAIGQDKISVRVEETYIITPMGDLQECELRIPIPQDHPKYQTVNNITYSERPYKTKVSNSQYAVFKLDKDELSLSSTIMIEIEIELTDYDLSIAEENTSFYELKKSERKRYLKNTNLYKLSANYLDGTLIYNSSDEIETANRIHDFVVDHISYQTFFGKSMESRIPNIVKGAIISGGNNNRRTRLPGNTC